MAQGDPYSQPDLAGVSILDINEHGHIGGNASGVPFKTVFSAPLAYKGFPSLTSGYVYHCIAPVGTASGTSLWRVMRETNNTGTIEWANGSALWINSLVDVTSLSFS